MAALYQGNRDKKIESPIEYKTFDIENEAEDVSAYNQILGIFRKAFIYVDCTFLEKKNFI